MVHEPHAVEIRAGGEALGRDPRPAPDVRRARCAGDRSGRLTGDAGLSLVLVGMMIIPLLTVTAFAVDLGAARSWRRQSQNASDSGALAGAILLPAGAGASARSEAAEVTARNLLVNQTAPLSAPMPPANCPSILGTMPSATSSTVQCFTSSSNGVTVYVATANPYDNALIGSSVPDDKLVWVRACKVQRHSLAPVFGQKTSNMCTQSVARNSAGLPLPAIFAMKTSPCDNTKGVNAGGGLHVYDSTGTPSGLIQSNCPGGMGLSGTALMDKSDKVITNAVGSTGGPPSGGWGTIQHSTGPPLPDPHAYPSGADPVPDFPSTGGDCFPDDAGAAFANCPARTTWYNVGGYKVWFPGRYSGGITLGEGETHYFMPGIYDIRGSVNWNAKDTSKVFWLTNNGKGIGDPTDPGCGLLSSVLAGTHSCPPPLSGSPSTTNRGGGALWYISGDGNMYGIGAFHMYPIQNPASPYAGMSMMCNRTNGVVQEWQLDGPLVPPGNYDLNGEIYCSTRNIEVHGNLTLKNGRLWAGSIEYDGGPTNISVYTPAGDDANTGDLALEY